MPIRIRLVRAAIALATTNGELTMVRGRKWNSASQKQSMPMSSASSASSSHSSKACASVRPSRVANLTKIPNSMLVDLPLLAVPRLGGVRTPAAHALQPVSDHDRGWRLEEGIEGELIG